MTNSLRKYQIHRQNARQRGIPWNFTYDTWWRVWRESGYWHKRGRGKGQYVMARFGDTGPYDSGNVKICTAEENASEGQLGNHNRRGAKLSADAKAKISAARLGKKHSAETRLKISLAKKASQTWGSCVTA